MIVYFAIEQIRTLALESLATSFNASFVTYNLESRTELVIITHNCFSSSLMNNQCKISGLSMHSHQFTVK